MSTPRKHRKSELDTKLLAAVKRSGLAISSIRKKTKEDKLTAKKLRILYDERIINGEEVW